MKINKIKINGFGNLENKEIDFKEHINLIYGKNEAGKSTLLKFIISMFYGVSKNKRGKDISDLEKYKPWNQADFSGKLSYELANGESYEIFREFQKKSPKLFNKEMEDIAGSYSSDKIKGNEFFFEQTKIDEELFTSSLASLQTQTKIELQDQNLLIQKITNLVSTGDDSVSYQKIIDKLNKKQTEEIGTEKTKGRPINIICERLQEIDRQQKELKQYESSKYEIQEQKQKIQEELKRELIELEVVKKLKEMEEQNSIEKEKIKLSQEFLDNLEKNMLIKKQEKLRIEAEEKELRNEQKEIEKQIEAKQESKIKPVKYFILFFIILIINLLIYFFIKNDILKIISPFLFLFLPVIYLLEKNKNRRNHLKRKNELKNEINQKQQEINYRKEQLEKEIQNIFQVIQEKQQEIQQKRKETEKKEEIMQNEVILSIKEQIEISKVEELLKNPLKNILLQELQSKVNEKQIEIQKLELQEKNILPQLEKLASMKEELETLEENKKELQETEKAIQLVKEILTTSYQEMKNNVTPKFTENLSKNIEKISKGKYQKVKINEQEGLIVEVENGNYMPVSRLSIGTIDQLYLSLRLAVLEEVTNEPMPIILDETFAYYDDQRLENFLQYIEEELKDHQIIILTCSNREKQILEKLGIAYQYYTLS